MQGRDQHRPYRQDTFDLREQISPDSSQTQMQAHADAAAGHYDPYSGAEDEEGYSIMDHDSDGEDRDEAMYEDDLSSELSIPDESINFDLVYSLHSFAATVEGQANVVKGDSLILMDDSNSYWWLVKVLKTQEVGYIPAENIETPFERLARLNKHRNVDLASATEHEREEENSRSPAGERDNNKTPSPDSNDFNRSRSRLTKSKSVQFNSSFPVHRYLPAVWNEDEEEDDGLEWDDVPYIGEDPALADEEREREMAAVEALGVSRSPDTSMEDAGQWNPNMTLEEMQAHARARQLHQQQQYRGTPVPAAFHPGGESPQPTLQIRQQSPPEQHILHHSSSRERMKLMDPLEAQETRKVSMTPSVARGDEGAVGPLSLGSNNPFLTNANLERERHQQQQQEEVVLRAKRRAEEDAAAAEEAKKRSKSSSTKDASARAASPVSSSSSHASSGKLRKDPSSKDKDKSRDTDSEESGSSTKKKGGIFRIFSKRDKDKDKNKVERGGSIGSLGSFISQDSTEKDSSSRLSEESSRSGHGFGHRNTGSISGSVDIVIQQQQPPQQRLSPQSQAQSPSPQQQYQQQQQSQLQYSTPERPTAISSHATQLRQRDQQQQALYQQYLNRSPSSGPETQPSYGLQSASALVSSSTFRGSPGPAVTPSAVTGSNAASLAHNANPATTLHTNANSTHPNLAPPPTSTSTSTPTARPRPGSLILIPGMAGIDGQPGGGQGLPDLSVMRVFAGRNLQTEATFKTVLLSSSTTAAELVKQAIQRFRLPEASGGGGSGGGEGSGGMGIGGALESVAAPAAAAAGGGGGASGGSEYYLTVKRVEGGASAILRSHEKPLVVFESLVLQALQDEAMDAAENLPPRVKRSSILSISSVASNLSMHPAIRKLPMNDFTDDSAVKFYLNRTTSGERDSAGATSIGGLLASGGGWSGGDGESSDGGSLRYRLFGDDDEMEEHTLIAELSQDEVGGEGDVSITSSSSAGNDIASMFSKDGRYLGIAAIMANVTPERFSSPSLRFALQLVIHPNDLPDDMVFHPFTEAIVPKDTLSVTSPGPTSPSASFRRKVFMFPKNVTVADVIELGLERFGILEGVVDGGDEVEDKLVKRRSSSRVRYGLHIDIGHGPERELPPSSKVIDAYLRPPAYKSLAPNSKRRSIDATHLLGNPEDVSPDDPIFILRRATSYRNSTSRHRMSAPLDEIALQQLHHQRDSTASSAGSDAGEEVVSGKSRTPPSRQEIIAAQRAVMRANQRAILSAQTNSVRGMDVLLPNNAVLRSGRFDSSDRLRYSYVEPDGESYDISDIVAEEWREHGRQDVLAGVVGKNRSTVDSEKLDRVLHKIRNGKIKEREREKKARAAAGHNASGSADMRSLMSMDSGMNSLAARSMSAADSLRSMSPSEYSDTDRPATPGSTAPQNKPTHARAGSALSYMSDERMYGISGRPGTATPTGNNTTVASSGTTTPTGKASPGPTSRRNPSIASVVSEPSTGKNTPTFSASPLPNPFSRSQASSRQGQYQHNHHPSRSKSQLQPARRPIIKDDFGIEHMMAVIECRAALMTLQGQSASQTYNPTSLPPLEPADEILFGRPINLESLHPRVRDIYVGGFKLLEDLDKLLDEALGIGVH